MARFDVYRDPDSEGYVVDCQSDFLEGMRTRVVMPLLTRERIRNPINRLNPVFEIDGVDHVLVPQFIASLPEKALGAPVMSLRSAGDQITAALDMLTSGF